MIVALNRVQVINDEHLMQNMKKLGAFMCTITAASEGFIGFQINMQSGLCSFGGKFGAAQLDMTTTLSHIWLEQYTIWESVEAHEAFHADFEDAVMDACKKCQAVILRGPEEFLYEVVDGQMPNLTTSAQFLDVFHEGDAVIQTPLGVHQGRTIALAPHYVRPGQEEGFEISEIKTMRMLADTPGFIGWMILKQIGMSPTGSAAWTTESLFGEYRNSSNNKLIPRFSIEESKPSVPTYHVHMEWQTPAHAKGGLARLLANPRIAKEHYYGVFDRCILVPELTFNTPLMEEYDWRDRLPNLDVVSR